MNNESLLEIKDLSIVFKSEDFDEVEITDKVNFTIKKGEIFGLVGESGCGKTVTSLSILQLLPRPSSHLKSGSITLNGVNLLDLTLDKLRKIRGKDVGIIFQEPSAALNPLILIKKQLLEVFDYHEYEGNPLDRIIFLLKRVGFPDPGRILKSYPYQLSGGMLQRVMIAMALLLHPSLIIADEPTTALDVTVQAQIMQLLLDMQKETNSSILLITHNLNLIAQYANRLAVMYAGRIVEESDCESFFKNQLHPYSQGLLNALPDLSSENPKLIPIEGQVPQPKDYAPGCRFQRRCPKAFELCSRKPLITNITNEHSVACFLYSEHDT